MKGMDDGHATFGELLEERKEWREGVVYERKPDESFSELVRLAGFENGCGRAMTNPHTGETVIQVIKGERMLTVEMRKRRGKKYVLATEWRRA